jgi:hypothetical protein
MIILATILGISVFIERTLELLSHLADFFIAVGKHNRKPSVKETNRQIKLIEQYIELGEAHDNSEKASEAINNKKKALLQENDTSKKTALQVEIADLERKFGTMEWGEDVKGPVITAVPATDPDNGWAEKSFIMQTIGCALGIISARFSQIGLFGSLINLSGLEVPIADWVDYLFTGILIGAGSGPVHTLIRFVSARKFTLKETVGKIKDVPEVVIPIQTDEIPSVPSIITKPYVDHEADWVDIPYTGGIDVEKLDLIHRRQSNPTGIIYHHTTMHLNSTFQDVVRVIKNRKDSKGNPWITGYNCVITYDGAIHPFCRWDRYGNHATGYNAGTLGIAFNGNFETNPAISSSNPDGRYGKPVPTDEQLIAAARVTALWTFLYKIPVDFTKSIIPHKDIADKACPGSSFSYDLFKKSIERFCSKWRNSQYVQEKIEEYKTKPFLYI